MTYFSVKNTPNFFNSKKDVQIIPKSYSPKSNNPEGTIGIFIIKMILSMTQTTSNL